MVFIGPTPASIRLFGDKISAKNLVQKAKGPTVPGYQGADQEISTLLHKVEEIGYPVIVKAAAGGGGRGLKVIREKSEAKAAIEAAQREGLSAFGSSQVFLEKYLERAKHIEVQIFGDALGRVRHLGERECSIQRRHQKMIEEAPAANLDPDLRRQMAQVAVAIAQEAQYRGAGTVEFLLEEDQFYFLEMNTRLQVEHPVTELVYGVDLVKAQLVTAMGQALEWPEVLQPRGHAIECRILAEDPYQGGMPSLGALGSCHWPQGPGRRFEVGFERGDEVTQFYDSMIAKVIVWDESRLRAIQKMRRTLEETVIFGLKTNIPLLQEILKNGEFVSGRMNTRFMDKNFPKGLSAEDLGRKAQRIAEHLQKNLTQSFSGTGSESSVAPNPWQYEWGQR
jgi:acetyl/propionyl-CoA carboxylase alpha subunit